ncbi:MAG TPA: HDOD domain-containing protein [Acidimicrobiales bacterium]|nr:HDOD domain-containing protein [Acidimicrobiales bacterium]
MSRFMVGRQPIFDNKLDVRGYELLFRDPGMTLPGGDAMTADVLVRAGLDLGLGNLVGNKLAFVNATRPFLVGEQDIPFPPEQTVIEILAGVAHDAEAVSGCRWLVSEGYRLAFDDYDWNGPDDPLLEFVSIIKLDIQSLSKAQLETDVEKTSGRGIELVALKVETQEQLKYCKELGFDLFQGYLLSRPEIVEGTDLSPSKATCLRVVNELCDPYADAHDIQHVVEMDPALSYRFLRLAGEGAARGLYRKISSVREGVVLLGRQKMRAWIMLMLLAGTSHAASEQLRIAMTRARMSELMGGRLAPETADSAFTVGLVSALDLLLGAPLGKVVASLNLADELVDALMERGGLLGRILADVMAWEMGGSELRLRCGLSLGSLERSYLDALAWSTEICSLMEETEVVASLR